MGTETPRASDQETWERRKGNEGGPPPPPPPPPAPTEDRGEGNGEKARGHEG